MTDPNEFEVFMRNYQDMVFSTAVRLLGNETDAEDIAQAVFLKAYENFGQIAASPTAGGWLKTVTTNLSLNHLTRYRARWRFFSEMRSEEREDEFVEDLPAPDRSEQDLRDYRRLLEAALRKLPAAQRVPLVLFHFEDQSYEEISTRLNISQAKLKTDMHRGRRALARYLKPGLSGDSQWEVKSGQPTNCDMKRRNPGRPREFETVKPPDATPFTPSLSPSEGERVPEGRGRGNSVASAVSRQLGDRGTERENSNRNQTRPSLLTLHVSPLSTYATGN